LSSPFRSGGSSKGQPPPSVDSGGDRFARLASLNLDPVGGCQDGRRQVENAAIHMIRIQTSQPRSARSLCNQLKGGY
jgi:hypothetical protein